MNHPYNIDAPPARRSFLNKGRFRTVLRGCCAAGAFLLAPMLGATPISLALWDFESDSVAAATAANVTASTFSVSSGSIGFQNGGTGDRIANASAWSQSDTFSTSGKYFEFFLGSASGFELELSQLSLDLGRTTAGPPLVTIQYSLDGFATAGSTLLSGGSVTSTDANSLNSFSLSSNLPAATTNTVTFRIWGYDASGTGNLRIDNVNVLGTLNSLGGPSFWDTNGSDPGIGGSGTWSSSSTLFSTSAAGDVVTIARTSSDPVIFGGTAGTVTVDGTVQAGGGISFSSTGYLLQEGTITLGTTNTISTGSGVAATITSALAGSNGLLITGSGTLNLEGDLSGLEGAVTLSSGAAVFGAATSVDTLVVNGGSGTIAAGETLTLTESQLSGSGGALSIEGTLRSTVTGSGWSNPGTAVTVQSTGTVVQQGNSAATNFIFGSNVTWEEGSTFIFRDWTFTPAASNRTYEPNIVFESTGDPMAVSLGSGTNPLVFSGNFTIGENVTFSYGSFGSTVSYLGDITVAGALGHDVGASSFTLGNSRELILEDNGTLRIRDDHTVTMDIGSAVRRTGSASSLITGGSIAFGGLRDFIVENGSLTVESVLEGTAPGSRLVKLGDGTLILTGDMTGGAVRLGVAGSSNGGSLVIQSDGSLGSGQFQFNYGTLQASGARVLANDVSIGGRVGADVVLAGDSMEFTGGVSFFGSELFRVVIDNQTTLSGTLANSNGEGLSLGGGGQLRISGDASGFTDAVTVSDTLTLLIDGTLNASSVTIGAGATVGGGGLLAGDLVLESGATWSLGLTETLTVSGAVSFGGGFDITSILGLDQNTPLGTYTLITGTATDFSTLGLGNFGIAKRADLGNGVFAYFDSGSLQLVVIPEPAHFAIFFGALALVLAMVRQRRLKAVMAA